MQLDTLVKLGSLVFSIAQDEKVREAVTMVRRGARRRGLIGPPPGMSGAAAGNETGSATASGTHSTGGGASQTGKSVKPGTASKAGFSPQSAPLLPPALRRYVNRRTVGQMARWTRRAAELLIDPPRQR